MLADFPPRRITPEFVRCALHHRGYVRLWQDGKMVERMEPFSFTGPAPAGCFDPRKPLKPSLTPRGREHQTKLSNADKPRRRPNTVIDSADYRFFRPIIRRVLR